MSEHSFGYSCHFATPAEAVAFADEVERIRSLEREAQTAALEQRLGLERGHADSSLWVGSVTNRGVQVDLVVGGPTSARVASTFPQVLLDRGCILIAGSVDDSRTGSEKHVWYRGSEKITRKAYEQAAAELDPLAELRKILSRQSESALIAEIEDGLDPNVVVDGKPLVFHLFSGKPQSKAVVAVVNAGARVDAVDAYGCTPLHHAASCLDIPAMKALVAHGADVGALDGEGKTPLHSMVSYGYRVDGTDAAPGLHLDAVRYLLDVGADINAASEQAGSVLAATWTTHAALRQLLVERGARLVWPRRASEADPAKRCRYAIRYHDNAVAEEILATLEIDEPLRRELLAQAISSGNARMFERLWRTGDHAFLPMLDRYNKVLVSAASPVPGAAEPILRAILERGGRQDAATLGEEHRRTLRQFLDRFLYSPEHVPALRLLIEMGVPIAADRTYSPLAFAIGEDQAEIVRVLLEAGVDPNASGVYDRNALHVAVQSKAYACIPLLLEFGTDRSKKDTFGQTPLELAAASKNKKAQALLA
ncbi:MAG TPA: ankyrin repeat domain-containing protein [Dokdonella sp.]|nr:ankyrin repeat domain-containing protein [Dokdonella sp.]